MGEQPSAQSDSQFPRRDTPGATEHEDARGFFYITPGGQRYHYEWCHDCGGDGCDYCEGVGQIRVDG